MPAQQDWTPPSPESLLSHQHAWLLVLGHPGHELRAHHLMERVRPHVVLLTDGSGATATPRLEESRTLIARAGGRPGVAFGCLSDREAYSALMEVDARPFLALSELLTEQLLTDDVRAVVVDAAEGYNPVHDVCHWIGRAATIRAQQRGARIALFELDLLAHPDCHDTGLRLQLDDQAFARKLQSTSEYVALKADVEAAFERYGREAFRIEFLRRVEPGGAPRRTWAPHYDEVGSARVREGRYASAIRYAAHVRPVLERLFESTRPPQHATDLGTLHQQRA